MATHHIEIGDISPRIQYTGDGSQTVFTYPFPIFADADMAAFEDQALKILTTHYTVSGAGNSSGGSVTFGTAPANGVTVTLKRQLAIQRTSDFQESGEFRSKVINDELDTLTAALQQVDDGVSRSLRLSDTDTAGSLTLPDKAARSSLYLGFDADGDPIATDAAGPQGPTGPGGNMDGANNLSELTNVGAARTNIGLGASAVENVAAGGSGNLLRADGDGAGLTGIATGATEAEKANIMLNAFRIAINGGLSVQNMVDGVVDEYADETGLASSVNMTLVGGHFANLPSEPVGNTAPHGAFLNMGAFTRDNHYGGMTFTPTINGTVTELIIPIGTNGSPHNTHIEIWSNASISPDAKLGSSSDGIYIDGSQDNTDLVYTWSSGSPALMAGVMYWAVWVDEDAGAGLTGMSVTAAGTDHYSGGGGPASPTPGITGIGDNSWGVPGATDFRWGVTVAASTALNGTLISIDVTALAQPDDAFIVLWQEDVAAIILNTDLKAYASRDGGTTWTQITLAEEATLTTGRILTGSADISGQPSGTSMKYKIETLNTKDQKIHGVGLQWS